jgi:hypothetical protein
MNLLARILSHGFALAVVVLLGVALMYRGDLFPEWQLPEFLVIEDDTSSGADDASPVPEDTATASAETAVTEPAEAPQVDVVAQDAVPPVDEAVTDMDVTTAEPGPVDAAVVEDVVDTEAAPEEPVVVMTDKAPEAAAMTGADITASVPDEADVAAPHDNADSDQTEATLATPPAGDTTSEDVTEQAEDTPLTPSVTDTDTTSEGVTEQAEDTPLTPSVTDTDTTSEGVTEQVESPVPEAAAPMPVADPVAEPDPESEPEPEPAVAEMPVAPAGDGDGKNAYALLAAAREAYWLHDFEMAETHYQQLIQMEPDNPDGYGELGNMYFAQGQWEQAAAAYYEAGVRLLEAGKAVQARQMVDVIRGLNGVQADELEKQINAAN